MSAMDVISDNMQTRSPVKRKPPGRFHHPDLREALILAGLQGIEQHGHLALSLRELAGRLGVTQPAVYRHFDSKEALLAAVADRGLAGFDRAMHDAVAAHPDDPFAAVAAVGRAYVRHAHQHPGWFRLQFSRARVEELARPQPPQASGSDARAALLGALAAIAGEGPIVFDLFRTVWGLAHGLAVFVVERVFQLVDTDAARIAAADDAIDVLIDCLRARYR
jgi:AcrR family transcriptional regulator